MVAKLYLKFVNGVGLKTKHGISEAYYRATTDTGYLEQDKEVEQLQQFGLLSQ